jgi:hypothetical protein
MDAGIFERALRASSLVTEGTLYGIRGNNAEAHQTHDKLLSAIHEIVQILGDVEDNVPELPRLDYTDLLTALEELLGDADGV